MTSKTNLGDIASYINYPNTSLTNNTSTNPNMASTMQSGTNPSGSSTLGQGGQGQFQGQGSNLNTSNNYNNYDYLDRDDMGFAAHPDSRSHPRHWGKDNTSGTTGNLGGGGQMTQTTQGQLQGQGQGQGAGAGSWNNTVGGGQLTTPGQMGGGLMSNLFAPLNKSINMDVIETPKSYILHADLPGYNKKDINVSIHNGMLTISAHRGGENVVENQGQQGEWIYRRVERSQGTISRSMRVPGDADASKLQTARFEEGMLKLEIPKLADKTNVPQPTKIPIH